MQTTAAVLERPNTAFSLVEFDLESPRAGEVLVEIGATGVCHSDLSVYDATLGNPMPIVLGHEGAGTVVAVGDGVTGLGVGDRVVLAWLAQCGGCFYCLHGQSELCEQAGFSFARSSLPDGSTRLSRGGRGVFQMAGLGTFARHCVVPAGSAVKVPGDLPFEAAALIGCAALTGFGSAVNTADIEVGDSVAVIGGGGVGLNAIQGARASGAGVIVVVDPNPARREAARAFGATHAFEPAPDLAREIRALTEGRGVDVAIEAVGRADAIDAAVRVTRRSGQVVLVGAAGEDVLLSVPAFPAIVMTGKRIIGSLYGSANVRRDVPRLVELYRRGVLRLDELVTETFVLEQINDALDYCAAGRGTRAVVIPK
jgi:Zn-dependent alcohol dehydrogenase